MLPNQCLSTRFFEFGEEKLLSPKFPLLDNLKKFHDTTTLIFSNAKAYTYNEDSQIYQDAVILEEYFNEQYNKLKSRIELEADKLHPSTPKLKLNLVVNWSLCSRTSIEEKRKRSIKQEFPEEQIHEEEDIDITQSEPTNADTQDIDEPADSKELDTSKSREVVTERNAPNTMGKTLPFLLNRDSIIQNQIFSSPAVSTNITKFVQQKSSQPATILSRDQEIKKSLFPTQPETQLLPAFPIKFQQMTLISHTISKRSPALCIILKCHYTICCTNSRSQN